MFLYVWTKINGVRFIISTFTTVQNLYHLTHWYIFQEIYSRCSLENIEEINLPILEGMPIDDLVDELDREDENGYQSIPSDADSFRGDREDENSNYNEGNNGITIEDFVTSNSESESNIPLTLLQKRLPKNKVVAPSNQNKCVWNKANKSSENAVLWSAMVGRR